MAQVSNCVKNSTWQDHQATWDRSGHASTCGLQACGYKMSGRCCHPSLKVRIRLGRDVNLGLAKILGLAMILGHVMLDENLTGAARQQLVRRADYDGNFAEVCSLHAHNPSRRVRFAGMEARRSEPNGRRTDPQVGRRCTCKQNGYRNYVVASKHMGCLWASSYSDRPASSPTR